MNEDTYEYDIEQLGMLNDRLRRLQESDYVTAYYKGYSSEGLTLDEVNDAIEETEEQIHHLETALDEDDLN